MAKQLAIRMPKHTERMLGISLKLLDGPAITSHMHNITSDTARCANLQLMPSRLIGLKFSVVQGLHLKSNSG